MQLDSQLRPLFGLQGSIHCEEVTRKYMRELMEEKLYTSKVCFCKLLLVLIPKERSLLFSPWYLGGGGREGEFLPQREIYAFVLGK